MSPATRPFLRLSLLSLLSLVSAQTASVTSDVNPVISGTSVVVAATTLALSIDSALPQTPLYTPTDGFSIPDLTAIVETATNEPSIALSVTPTQGSIPTIYPNAPPIPATLPIPTDYPTLDKTPPTNSTEVQQWLSELDLSDIPNLSVTNGTCGNSPEAAADPDRCWWTCGGCTRPSDIVECPNKYDWGVSHDDGPSPYTPALLDYLASENVKTTFFSVGSRVISRGDITIASYLDGHQICVHTWSHPYMTTLTNEQIVAELGWTKKVIKETIGVTPNMWRPPYGDVDDRVRAIAAKMGLQTVIWSRANGVPFDTTDWDIPAGYATGESCLAAFENILDLATGMDTGFIVLEHDLWPQTVDMAIGYILPLALNSTSPFKLKNIAGCLGLSQADAYIETSSNTTQITQSASASSTDFPAVNQGSLSTVASSATSGGTVAAQTTGSGATSASGSGGSAASTTAASSSSSSDAMGLSLAGSAGVKGLVGLVGVALGAIVLL